ncbi:MAG TPA: DAK2 domain-containing protein [Actinomycetales bacterium]
MLDTLTPRAARRWAVRSLADLVAQRPSLDRSNVYPVADGDTGTNMVLTLQAGVRQVEQHLGAEADLARLGSAFARGALLGARGSSGVILSQWLRGAGEVLGRGDAGAHALAAALRRAADEGFAAVSRPVEGTMLTVARAAADGARGGTLADVVLGAATSARSALARTPDQLAVLSAAGVVDAGGRGLLVLLDALADVVTGRERIARPEPESLAAPPAADPAPGGPTHEVMFVLDAGAGPVARLRERLDALGESVVVVGGDGLWSVHVHTDVPDAAVEAGRAAGAVRDVRTSRLDSAAGAP